MIRSSSVSDPPSLFKEQFPIHSNNVFIMNSTKRQLQYNVFILDVWSHT